jgi:hypothetical protein
METRQELLLKFMLALTANAEVMDWLGDKTFTNDLANFADDLVDEYYKRIS